MPLGLFNKLPHLILTTSPQTTEIITAIQYIRMKHRG